MAYSYARPTYDWPNPVVRVAHRSRFRAALGLVRQAPGQMLLGFGFGCGDGQSLRRLSGRGPEGVTLLGFDPLAPNRPGTDRAVIRPCRQVLVSVPIEPLESTRGSR